MINKPHYCARPTWIISPHQFDARNMNSYSKQP